MLIGADSSYLYVGEIHAECFELNHVGSPKVNVRFGIAVVDDGRGKTCTEKLLCHFFAYFKCLQADAWPNHGFAVSGGSTISMLHFLESFFCYPLYCSAPSRMDGSYGLVCFIIDEYGHTVGCRHANALLREVR